MKYLKLKTVSFLKLFSALAMAETGKEKCSEIIEGSCSIIVPKRGLHLRAALNIFFIKNFGFYSRVAFI